MPPPIVKKRFRCPASRHAGKGKRGVPLFCACLGLTEGEIEAAIAQGTTTIEALQEKLGIGTGCRSCLPLLEALLAVRKSNR